MEDEAIEQREAKLRKMKDLLQYHVAKICEQEGEDIGLRVSRRCSAVLADVVFDHATTIASDLEMFAKHARRATVNTDDVLLCVRKNPSASQQLTTFAAAIPKTEVVRKPKKQKIAAAD